MDGIDLTQVVTGISNKGLAFIPDFTRVCFTIAGKQSASLIFDFGSHTAARPDVLPHDLEEIYPYLRIVLKITAVWRLRPDLNGGVVANSSRSKTFSMQRGSPRH